ncbi:MAG: hypothetical protein U1E76_04015 [Planctomycetota bacterium]
MARKLSLRALVVTAGLVLVATVTRLALRRLPPTFGAAPPPAAPGARAQEIERSQSVAGARTPVDAAVPIPAEEAGAVQRDVPQILAQLARGIAAMDAGDAAAVKAALEPLLEDLEVMLSLARYLTTQAATPEQYEQVTSLLVLAIRSYAANPSTRAYGDSFDPRPFFRGLLGLLRSMPAAVARRLLHELSAASALDAGDVAALLELQRVAGLEGEAAKVSLDTLARAAPDALAYFREALDSADPQVRARALEHLFALQPESSAALAVQLYEGSQDQADRLAIAEVVARAAPADRVLATLRDLCVREDSGLLLGVYARLGERLDLATLERSLRAEPDPLVRKNLLVASAANVPLLVQFATQERDRQVREQALLLLASAKPDAEVARSIATALADPESDPWTMVCAAENLFRSSPGDAASHDDLARLWHTLRRWSERAGLDPRLEQRVAAVGQLAATILGER